MDFVSEDGRAKELKNMNFLINFKRGNGGRVGMHTNMHVLYLHGRTCVVFPVVDSGRSLSNVRNE